MSLLGLQSALAYVIRSYDAHGTKNIDDLTERYELTHDEVLTLKNLINQQRLKSYSEELFLARWTTIRESIEFLQPLVNLRALSDLFEQDFEKKNLTVVSEELALKFVEYLMLDQVGAEFIRSNPNAFLPDLIKYTHTIFTFSHNALPSIARPSQSLLTDRYFAVVTLDFDVRRFFSELVEIEEDGEFAIEDPPKRPITLLFIASEEVTEFRSFEIDQELVDFLQAQQRGDVNVALPSCFDDLVDVGLCKSGSTKRACCNKTH